MVEGVREWDSCFSGLERERERDVESVRNEGWGDGENPLLQINTRKCEPAWGRRKERQQKYTHIEERLEKWFLREMVR